MAGVVSPLAVPNSTQFIPIPLGSNNQPVMMPGKSIVIALNATSYTYIYDSQGNVKMFATPNVKYTLSGSEKYVNSGCFLKDKNNHTQDLEIHLPSLSKRQDNMVIADDNVSDNI